MAEVFQDSKTLKNRSLTFIGEFARWPDFYKGSPVERASKIGAEVIDSIDENTDFVVVGAKRKKGRAEGLRKAKALVDKGASLKILDEEEFIYLTRPFMEEAKFVFAGGFEFCPPHVTEGGSYSVVESVGCQCGSDVNEETQFLIIGEKRGKGKAAALKALKKLEDDGKSIECLTEEQFLNLMSCYLDLNTLDFQGLLVKLRDIAVGTRLSNAMKMLRMERIHLFSEIEEDGIRGIVQSHSQNMVYTCWINSEGEFACRDEDLEDCWSCQGQHVCKHLLVLVLGLVRSGELDAPSAFRWLKLASANRPAKKKEDELAKTLLRYKGVQQGEMDWRPTETLPEDFLAF